MEQTQKSRTGLVVALVVILSLIAGVGLGLLLGWVVWPVNYYDTDIADLSPQYKEEYTVLVASAYALDGDLEKVQVRLARLEVPNLGQWVKDLADRYIDEEQNEAEIQALVELAHGLGVDTPRMTAYRATPTPTPTDTPPPTDTAMPTDTAAPSATATLTSPPPSNTPAPPSDTPAPEPSDTPEAEPTDTPAPPTDTPKPTSPPKPTKTRTPPTATPKPVAKWTWSERLVGPGEDAQRCDAGSQQIRVSIVNANNGPISGIWVHELYSGMYQVSGHKADDPYWGPGDIEVPCPGFEGGGAVCIAEGQGGSCVTTYTRGMTCYKIPSPEDLHAAGYCNCCEQGASLERCRELINQGSCMGNGHYSWKVVFKRGW